MRSAVFFAMPYSILYDSRMLPLVDLREAYQIEGDYPDTALLVYVKSAKREGVIMIDSMYEQKRIVVKQLPALFGPGFRRHTGISGAVSWEMAKSARLLILKL